MSIVSIISEVHAHEAKWEVSGWRGIRTYHGDIPVLQED